MNKELEKSKWLISARNKGYMGITYFDAKEQDYLDDGYDRMKDDEVTENELLQISNKENEVKKIKMKKITSKVYIDNKNKSVEIKDVDGNTYFYGFEIFDKYINQD